ncbi:MAG: hypothetical protein ACLQOO_10020 [Terriglobia bacterium]
MADTITRYGWPDTSIDDGHNLYFVEEKSRASDALREDQVRKAEQLLRFRLSILIKIKVVNEELIEPRPAYAWVVWANPDGKLYGRGPWGYDFPPKAGQAETVRSVPGKDKLGRRPSKRDWRRVEERIVAEPLTIRQIVERTGLNPEQVLAVINKRTKTDWFHWFLIKFDHQAGTYYLQMPDGLETWTSDEDRKALVRAQAPHQFP